MRSDGVGRAERSGAFLTNWLATGARSGAVKPIAERKSVIVGDTYVAAAAMFGDAGRLTGIFCRALTGHQPRKAVVFVNAGAIYHVGWARMHVEMARELARSGIASLRFDLAGIGDSLAAETGAPLLYGALSDDIAAAIDWLEKRGIRDLTVFGSCSGAYQAFHAAISDRRIKRIALVNQLCFVWGPAYAVQLETWRRTKAAEGAARNNARNDAIAALSARGLMARLMPRAKQLTSPAQPTFSSAARCFGAARIWSSAGSPNYPGAARACCSSIPTTIQVWRSSNATWGRKDNARRQCPA